jgi:hypothetical protein
MKAPPDAATRLRVLECWLPLAQALNAAGGWGATAPALEALILAAAPALAQARTDLAARAILWHYYLLRDVGYEA